MNHRESTVIRMFFPKTTGKTFQKRPIIRYKDPHSGIVIFLLITLGLSSIFYFLIISSGTIYAFEMFYVLAWMWCPGAAALTTTILLNRNLTRLGWSWGGTRYQLLSYALPLAYSSLVYLGVWFSGLGRFAGLLDLEFLRHLFFSATIGVIVSSVSALGEEIGWRGFLVPELAKVTTFTKTSLISGVIWASWHYPLILFADYRGGTTSWYELSCFTLMIVGVSFPLAWLRLKSNSVWTAVLLHASHNLYVQGVFDPLTEDTGLTKYLAGEFGAALAAIAIPVAYIFWMKRFELPESLVES